MVNFFFLLCCYFEPCCTYLNLSIFLTARFKRCYEPCGAIQTSQHVSNGVWNVLYIQLQGWTSLCRFEPREQAFFNWFLVVGINFSRGKSNMFFLKKIPRSPEGPAGQVINSFQGNWILHESISGKCQFMGPKYAPYYHPRIALLSDCFSGYNDRL